jgi:hypothetical protein
VVAKRWRIVALAALGLLFLLLVYAWIDGGREDQRMIMQPVELTESGA